MPKGTRRLNLLPVTVRTLTFPLLVLLSGLLTSCESSRSTGYGYYLGELSDETILEFFALNDQAASRQDYDFYESFFSPNFTSVDRTESNRATLYREDYLSMVEEIFRTAKSIFMRTHVMDITYSDSRNEALVKIQEEEKTEQFGQTRHYTSLLDVELEIEDGWIFINKVTRTTKQVIEE